MFQLILILRIQYGTLFKCFLSAINNQPNKRFWLCPLFRINLIILCLSSLSFILYVACRLRLIRRIFVFLNISRLLGTVMQTFLHVIKVLVQVLVANRCFVIFQRSHWAIFPILVINFSFFSCKVSGLIRLLILIHRRAF